MGHIKPTAAKLNPGTTIGWSTCILCCVAVLVLPHGMFVTLAGLVSLCFWQTYIGPWPLLRLLHQCGFWALGLGLVFTSGWAVYPGEAFLQLLNFLPFFWIWAALTLHLRRSPNAWTEIFRWAQVLVLSVIPINLLGLAEFALKRLAPAQLIGFAPWIDWLYTGDLTNPRAFSLFHSPNTLASYLVMVLGLNLGLVLLRQDQPFGRLSLPVRGLLVINVLLTLGCLYASGSRNGYLVAVVLLMVGGLMLPTPRWVRSLGLAGLVFIGITTLQFGIGGRSISWDWVTSDPRIGVWKLALQMIGDRPWLGFGLGSYKLLYEGQVPGYDFIAHAHNLWLMLGAEAGLPVMVGFTLVIGLICWRGVKGLRSLIAHHHTNQAALLMGYHLCFLAAIVFSLLDITLFEMRVNLLGWLSLVVLYLAPDLSQSSPLDRGEHPES